VIDLVYLDPPFGTGRDRNGLRGRGGRHGLEGEAAYQDPRPDPSGPGWLDLLLAEVPRILRPGGALFLHLDYRSAPRARILLDGILGEPNFLNEIIWRYATGGIPRNSFARKHDTILYYRNGPGHTFHRLKEKKYLAHRMGRKGVEEYQDAGGWYRYRYLDDVWDIPWLTQDSRERTGYPTQKPVALLERILSAATDPGDLVADFCCGSGTTSAAAQGLGRRWMACDTSPLAVKIARERLESARGGVRCPGRKPQDTEEEDTD
jgi:DNA modification methylase